MKTFKFATVLAGVLGTALLVMPANECAYLSRAAYSLDRH
jgi:hypothetical protein